MFSTDSGYSKAISSTGSGITVVIYFGSKIYKTRFVASVIKPNDIWMKWKK